MLLGFLIDYESQKPRFESGNQGRMAWPYTQFSHFRIGKQLYGLPEKIEPSVLTISTCILMAIAQIPIYPLRLWE